jgi:hypothetical protein
MPLGGARAPGAHPRPRTGGAAGRHDDRLALDAVVYLLRRGC